MLFGVSCCVIDCLGKLVQERLAKTWLPIFVPCGCL